ncbi:MAG: acyl-CoA synthetase, partial [Acetobacteraceae bacterium]|nr:acyl-CoA synthetase [Acetobacteraceae bacterium]
TRRLTELEAEVATLHGLWGEAVAGAPVMATVPHHHIYGLVFKLLWPLASGRPFAAALHHELEALLASLPSSAVIVSSPAHLTRLGGLKPLPLCTRPRMVFSAGALLPKSAAEQAHKLFGVSPTEIYGSTETGALATRQGDVPWQPLPGNRIAASTAGRLRVSAPYVAQRASIELADRVSLTGDGRFHLLGRDDRIAKIEGKRVSLDDLERTLRELSLVMDAAALVLEDGPTLAAVVVPSLAGQEALNEEGAFRFGRTLRAALSDTHDPAALPRRWRFVDRIPEAALGKRPRDLLAALFRPQANEA